jgi:hypothetical protein
VVLVFSGLRGSKADCSVENRAYENSLVKQIGPKMWWICDSLVLSQ